MVICDGVSSRIVRWSWLWLRWSASTSSLHLAGFLLLLSAFLATRLTVQVGVDQCLDLCISEVVECGFTVLDNMAVTVAPLTELREDASNADLAPEDLSLQVDGLVSVTVTARAVVFLLDGEPIPCVVQC